MREEPSVKVRFFVDEIHPVTLPDLESLRVRS